MIYVSKFLQNHGRSQKWSILYLWKLVPLNYSLRFIKLYSEWNHRFQWYYQFSVNLKVLICLQKKFQLYCPASVRIGSLSSWLYAQSHTNVDSLDYTHTNVYKSNLSERLSWLLSKHSWNFDGKKSECLYFIKEKLTTLLLYILLTKVIFPNSMEK